MAWENHVYYFGLANRDRAAHKNISDRNLLSILPRRSLIKYLSEAGRMLELMNFTSGGPYLHVVH